MWATVIAAKSLSDLWEFKFARGQADRVKFTPFIKKTTSFHFLLGFSHKVLYSAFIINQSNKELFYENNTYFIIFKLRFFCHSGSTT